MVGKVAVVVGDVVVFLVLLLLALKRWREEWPVVFGLC